jgi:hypothetical protein
MIVTENTLPRWVRYAGRYWLNPGHPICNEQVVLWRIYKDGEGVIAPLANVYPAEPHQHQALEEQFKP